MSEPNVTGAQTPLPYSGVSGTTVFPDVMFMNPRTLIKVPDAVAASQTATTGGRKFDGGKLQYGLLPILALEENVKVLTFGAQKYEPDNWKRVPDGPRRYFDAANRHIWAYKSGELLDPETGCHHLAHAICCLQFIIDLDLSTDKLEQASKD